MYSRFSDFPRPADRPRRLPEQYSGCAFTEDDRGSVTPHRLEVANPVPPPPEACPAPPPPSPSFPFATGLDFDELLILGLMLLLAGNEHNSEIIPMLGLLLLWK